MEQAKEKKVEEVISTFKLFKAYIDATDKVKEAKFVLIFLLFEIAIWVAAG